MGLVERVVPRPGLDEQVAGIGEAQRYLHALGITGWQEAIVGDYAVVPDCFEAYLEAERRRPAHGPGGGGALVAARDRDRAARRLADRRPGRPGRPPGPAASARPA